MVSVSASKTVFCTAGNSSKRSVVEMIACSRLSEADISTFYLGLHEEARIQF